MVGGNDSHFYMILSYLTYSSLSNLPLGMLSYLKSASARLELASPLERLKSDLYLQCAPLMYWEVAASMSLSLMVNIFLLFVLSCYSICRIKIYPELGIE